MTIRPRSVTIVSWVLIIIGCAGLLSSFLKQINPATSYPIANWRSHHPFQYALGHLSPVLAILCGVFMLRGCNWARWLLIVWFGNAVAGDLLYFPWGLLQHSLLFAVVMFYLFRRPANEYFHGTEPESPEIPKSDETPVA
jgi:hypothetical protein